MYKQQTREVPVWSCVSQCSYYTDTFQLTPMPKLNLSPKWPWQWIIPLKNNSAEQWLCYSLTAHRGIVSKTHAAVTEPGSWESPQCMEDVDTLQQIQWGPQWWWRGWTFITWAEAERWDWPAWGREGSAGSYECLTICWGGSKEHPARLFSLALRDRTRGIRHRLKHRKIGLNIIEILLLL